MKGMFRGKCFIGYKFEFHSNANKLDRNSLHTKINVDLYVFGSSYKVKPQFQLKLQRCAPIKTIVLVQLCV